MKNITNLTTQQPVGKPIVPTTATGIVGNHLVLVGEAPLVRNSGATPTQRSSILAARSSSPTPTLGKHFASLGKAGPPRMDPQPYGLKTARTRIKSAAPAHTKATIFHRPTDKTTATMVGTRSTRTISPTRTTTILPALPDQSVIGFDRSAAAYKIVESVVTLNAPTSSPVGAAAKMATVQNISHILQSVVRATAVPGTLVPPLMASTMRSTPMMEQDLLGSAALLSTVGKRTTALSTTLSTLHATSNATNGQPTSGIARLTRIPTATAENSGKKNLLSAARGTTAALSTFLSAFTHASLETPMDQLTAGIQRLTHVLTETAENLGKETLLSTARSTTATLSAVLSAFTQQEVPFDPRTSGAERLTRVFTETAESATNKSALLAAARATTTALGYVITALTDAVAQDAPPTWGSHVEKLVTAFEKSPAQRAPSAPVLSEIAPGNTAAKRALFENRTPSSNTAEKKIPLPLKNRSPLPNSIVAENEPATGTPMNILEGYTVKRSMIYGVKIAYSSPGEQQRILNTLAAISQSPEGLALLQQIRDHSLILTATQSLLDKNRLSTADLKSDGGILHQVFPHPDPQEEATHIFVLDWDRVYTQTSLQSLLDFLAAELPLMNPVSTPAALSLLAPAQRIRTLQQELYLLEAALFRAGQSTQHISPIKGLLTDIKREWLKYETATAAPGGPASATITTLGRWLDMLEQQASVLFSQQTEATRTTMLELEQTLIQSR